MGLCATFFPNKKNGNFQDAHPVTRMHYKIQMGWELENPEWNGLSRKPIRLNNELDGAGKWSLSMTAWLSNSWSPMVKLDEQKLTQPSCLPYTDPYKHILMIGFRSTVFGFTYRHSALFCDQIIFRDHW